jgi:hypothetical protein
MTVDVSPRNFWIQLRLSRGPPHGSFPLLCRPFVGRRVYCICQAGDERLSCGCGSRPKRKQVGVLENSPGPGLSETIL